MLGDTIFALASAPGPSERAVLRISGPAARAAAAFVFAPELPAQRATVDGQLQFAGLQFAAYALVMVAPRSFTGEDVVELHVPGSPMLVTMLEAELLRVGASLGVRKALPGEFTARAVQNGRLDGIEVEGLLMLLHASDRRQAAAAVQWLRGGYAETVRQVRASLQDTLALLEVGLDFDDTDTGAVPASLWLPGLRELAQRLADLVAGVPAVTPGGQLLLLGRANAGKSSLANALAGRSAAIVDASPGTTRDLLRIGIEPGVVLWDAPGDLDEPSAIDAAALALRDRLAGAAAAALLVLDASDPRPPHRALRCELPWAGVVWTKCDLAAAPAQLPTEVAAVVGTAAPVFATSATDASSLVTLRPWLRDVARAGPVDAGGPLREALGLAKDAVARAVAASTAGTAGPEVVAVDLQAALRALDGIVGDHSPEALLDRIYGRFCLGK